MTPAGVQVVGAATAEEVAAVLAVLSRVGRAQPEATGYERWRATRRSALRRPAGDEVDGPT